jgi:hypothetical protein
MEQQAEQDDWAQGEGTRSSDEGSGEHEMHTLKRRAAMSAATVGLASVLVMSPVLAGDGNLVEGSVDYAYHCDSAVGHSEVAYTMVATAPDEVVQGDTFQVQGFVVTGVPPEDLLISHITFAIDPPGNATPESPLFFGYDGPGSTDPPGPIAKKGIPNSSPAMTFTMKATGPVGSTVDIYPGNVSSTVVNPDNLSQHLDVTCARDLPVLLTRTTIVAPEPTTTTTSTTSSTTSTTTKSTVAVSPESVTPTTPTTAQVAVLGESAAAPVTGNATLTG